MPSAGLENPQISDAGTGSWMSLENTERVRCEEYRGALYLFPVAAVTNSHELSGLK